MPRQNRVTPFGEFEATPARGLFMGNRGILHDHDGTIGSARWRHKNWVTCALLFKDRKAPINGRGHYTQIFFCDEATALAAGHRPCAECRRSDFRRFMAAWQRAHVLSAPPRVDEVDATLHRARVTTGRRQIRTSTRVDDLPDGIMITLSDDPLAAWLVWGGSLHRWSHDGYTEKRDRPIGIEVTVLTPEPTVQTLRAGYRPVVHTSATCR